MEVFLEEHGPFNKAQLVALHNKVVRAWNKNEHPGCTYVCSVIYKDGKRVDKYVSIPCRKAEDVLIVKVWIAKQTPIFIN